MINAYRIGVQLSMTQNVSAALGVIAGQMMGLHRHIDMAAAGFNRIGMAIAGAGAVLVGGGMLRGVGALIKAGEELVHQQTLLRMAGEDNASVARATQSAWGAAFSVQGTTAAGNLRVLGDLRGLFGDMKEAEQVLPRFAQFQRVLSTVTGQKDEKAGGIMAQALDLMGAVRFTNGELDQKRLDAFMNQAMASIINNRGRVGPEQIRNFVQQAGPAANVMTPQQLFGDMSVLIESMGGLRAGTGIAAMNRQFGAGIMTDRTYDTLRMIGMTTGPVSGLKPKERAAAAAAMQREMEGGATIDPASLVKVAPKGIKGADRIASGDYAGFVLQELVPKIEKFLQQSNQEVTQEAVLGMLSRVGGTGPGQRTAAQLFLSQQQIERERKMQAKIAEDPQRAVREMEQNDPKFAADRLRASWENLMTAFGAPAVPMAVRLMNMLAGGIDRLTRVVAAHPTAARMLVGIAAGLGVALVAIGALAIGALAISAIGGGGVAAVIIAIVASLGGLAAMAMTVNWSRLMGDLSSSFGQFWEWIKAVPTRAWEAISVAFAATTAYLRGVGQRAATDISGTFRQLSDAVINTVAGWGASFMGAVAAFQTSAAGVIQAVIDWLVGIPRRLLEGITVSPGAREGLLPPASPMGDEGGMGGASPSSFVPPAPGREVAVHTAVNLDGRTIANVVSRHQGQQLNAPQGAASFYDRRRDGLGGDVVAA